MGTFQKILTTSLWGITVLMMVFIVTAGIQMKNKSRASADGYSVATVEPASGDQAAGGLPVLFDAPQFSLIDQYGKPFSNADLKGKPWVSQFIFTTCQSICPMMMAKMSGLQTQIDPRVRFVSFSVDPDYDRPAVLLAKAKSLGANNDRWRFLTNPDGNKTGVNSGIDGVLRGMFEAKPGPLDPKTMHSERFFLFDGNGHCRGIYSSSTPESMDQLKADAATVLAEK
jgi:protein SCO1/2